MTNMVMYDEVNDGVAFAEVNSDTFAVVKREDGTFAPLTYNEWEALRCRQASEGACAKLADADMDEALKAEVSGMIASFSETMQSKYLHGNRSWVQLFDELLEDFTKLAG